MIHRKQRNGDRPDLREQYRETHLTCANCGATWRTFGSWLEAHHILGGKYGRVDSLENLLMLCQTYNLDGCHQLATDGKLTLANVLWLKWETDDHLGLWCPKWIQERMSRRRMPDLEEPSEELRTRK